MTFTPDGADYASITYEARFVRGVLSEIVETERSREPALSVSVYYELNGKFEEDSPFIDTSEPEIGAEMYVLWGSIDRNKEGYPARLIAKTKHDWAFEGRHGRIETIPPSQLGNCLFHSETDAKAMRSWDHTIWDRKVEYCKRLLEAKSQISVTA